MEKFAYGRYILPGGWGGYGVYLTDGITKTYSSGVVEIKDGAVVVGNGAGWDDNGVFDEEWLKRATKLMNAQENGV